VYYQSDTFGEDGYTVHSL